MTTESPDEDAMPDLESSPIPRRGAKRNRTEEIPEWWYECMESTGQTVLYTPAKLAENYYEYVATVALGIGQDPAYAWLMPPKDRDWKVSLLVELGRFGDEATIRKLAAQLCATQPKVREALASLRRQRLGEQAPPPKPLSEAIVRLVAAHLGRHPTTPSEEVRDALVRAAKVLDRRLIERDRERAPGD
jgi:hypothetical protein